jgi:hypothetical protein
MSFVTLSWLTLMSAAVSAQTGMSSIAGVVKDTSGAVLPGVTVEAASPALIEKVRTVVTDSQGQYKIVGLVPGTYTVTFTLTGFGTIKREGIQLTTNFTATVDADLKVGAVEETVTVSGQSPVVDVQNVSVRNIIAKDVLDAVPSGGRTLMAYASLTPGISIAGTGTGGVSQDVGGTKGETYVLMTIHGSRQGDARVFQDGFETTTGNQGRVFVPNPGSAQEMSLELGSGGAEARLGGIVINFIPKEGGNGFRGDLFTTYADHNFQGTNVSDEVRTRGLSASNINRLEKVWDVNGSLGGPLKQDTLWFFMSHRSWSTTTRVAGVYENKTPQGWTYTPDLSRPAHNEWRNRHHNGRITWQAAAKHKFGVSYDWQDRCDCFRDIDAVPQAPEATDRRFYRPNDVIQATWTHPATNKLLFQAGVARNIMNHDWTRQPGLARDTIAVIDEATNFRYRAKSVGQPY